MSLASLGCRRAADLVRVFIELFPGRMLCVNGQTSRVRSLELALTRPDQLMLTFEDDSALLCRRSFLVASGDADDEFVAQCTACGLTVTRDVRPQTLSWAAEHGYTDRVYAMIMTGGVDPGDEDVNMPPVCIAAHFNQTSTVALLLEHGAHPNTPCVHGCALAAALKTGAVDAAAELLIAGATLNWGSSPSAIDLVADLCMQSKDETALHLYARIMLAGADPAGCAVHNRGGLAFVQHHVRTCREATFAITPAKRAKYEELMMMRWRARFEAGPAARDGAPGPGMPGVTHSP